MIYKWNILKKDFAKEIILLYLTGCEEMKNKSLEIFDPRDQKRRMYIDLYVPEKDKMKYCPGSCVLGALFSGIMEMRGSIIEIDKDEMMNLVMPIPKNDLVPLWDKLKHFEIEKGTLKIRSLDTEDLIKELQNEEKDFLLT